MLRSARALFAAHGYASTSNRMIGERAGLAHTAIYNHFGSKARLFTAVFVDVQDQLINELQRSASSVPDEAAFPRALLDAIEALRAADPSYVEFLASMYVEVRRHPELREVFQEGEQFPIVDTLRALGNQQSPAPHVDAAEDPTWFWITFALGLAQLGALADPATFTLTIETFRRQFHPTEVAATTPPPLGQGTHP